MSPIQLMKKKLTLYQKPTCSKCRETLRLLKERRMEFEAINYDETPISEAGLRVLLKKLGVRPEPRPLGDAAARVSQQ